MAMRLTLRLLEEQRRGDASHWKLYVPTIPGDYSPVMWDEASQRKCLEGTPSESRIPRRFTRKAAEHRLLSDCDARRAGGAAEPNWEELLRWAQHSVASRSYESRPGRWNTSDGRPGAVMVPFADMFNDDPSPNAAWEWNAATDAFEISAKAALAAGEEVLLSYGTKTNDQLLTHYGFVHLANARDVVYLDLVQTTAAALAPIDARLALCFDVDTTRRSRRGGCRSCVSCIGSASAVDLPVEGLVVFGRL